MSCMVDLVVTVQSQNWREKDRASRASVKLVKRYAWQQLVQFGLFLIFPEKKPH